jgi:hypothetical protein
MKETKKFREIDIDGFTIRYYKKNFWFSLKRYLSFDFSNCLSVKVYSYCEREYFEGFDKPEKDVDIHFFVLNLDNGWVSCDKFGCCFDPYKHISEKKSIRKGYLELKKKGVKQEAMQSEARHSSQA